MERWLSKAWVLVGLCGVLLLATVNRRDPMVYFMFLFLSICTLLGFVVPWLSLRGTVARLGAEGALEVMEGEGCDVLLQLKRTSPWPAFMVDVVTEWEWAGRRLTFRQTVPVLRRRAAAAVGAQAQPVVFPCRGQYRLVSVRLSSGFPLGLVTARTQMPLPQALSVHVLPRPVQVRWPLPWRVTADPLGDHTLRQAGPSYELGALRPYELGEAVGRVSWRASARAGELIIQHFHQTGSVRLWLLPQPPVPPDLGDAQSAAEQAVRLAAGVAEAAAAHGVQVRLKLPESDGAACDLGGIRRALAAMEPSPEGFAQTVATLAEQLRAGEQVAVVVADDTPPGTLMAALRPLRGRDCPVLVCVARAPIPDPRRATQHAEQLQALRRAVEHQAGFACMVEGA